MRSFATLLTTLVCCCFISFAAATGGASNCPLKGVYVSLPAPITYAAPSWYEALGLCTRRGMIINSNNNEFSGGEGTQANPMIIEVEKCIPDARATILPFTENNAKGDRYQFKVGNGAFSSSLYTSDSNDFGLLLCPSNGNRYGNITTIGGTGATGESTVTNIEIKVSSTTTNTGSSSYCVTKSYWIRIINKPCQIKTNECVPSQIAAFPTGTLSPVLNVTNGLLPYGGSPLPLQTLDTAISGTTFNLSLKFSSRSTWASISHMTKTTAGASWSAATPVAGLLNFDSTLIGSVGIQVPWNPARINGYRISVSSTSLFNQCSFINFILQFCNPPTVVSSTGTNQPSSSSSSLNSPSISSSSSSTGNSGGVGDPQFTGLRGQSFQVHGYDGAVFSIISNKHFQLNSLFVFLTGPRPCPIMPSGQRSVACWSHDGSYLGDIGLKTNAQDEILIKPGDAETGFAQVTFNNRSLEVGETIEFTYENNNLFGEDEENNRAADKMLQIDGLNRGKIQRISTHEILIEVSCFSMEIENVDAFVNVRRLSIPSAYRSTIGVLRTHGLLGQTWQLKRYKGMVKEIEGDVDDYVVEDGLFGNSFIFNRLSYI
jgi:hypothetical protein